jgi:hypothetical protein
MSEQGRNERAAAWPARTGASAKGRIICPAALDAGGRALLDAKQLGLEQGFHECRAIDGHERAVPSPAHVMDRRATSSFPNSAFALQRPVVEDRSIGDFRWICRETSWTLLPTAPGVMMGDSKHRPPAAVQIANVANTPLLKVRDAGS